MQEIDVIKKITGYSYDVSGLILEQIRESGITYGLKQIPGVGKTGIERLIAAQHINSIVQVKPKTTIKTSHAGFLCVKSYFTDMQTEKMLAVYLNRANKVLEIKTISTGGRYGTTCDCLLILKDCVTYMAGAVILAHNHPSGTLHPSEADKSITKKTKEALSLIDFSLLDHIIVAGDTYFSFADENLI